MGGAAIDVRLEDAAATDRLGAALAAALVAGDLVALAGDLGAGKTSLARAAIRSLAGDPALDVPSPTFTLVQTYATTPPVAHLDLYRIASSGELDELGLDEALETGVAFVEWPEKAGANLPEPALSIHLAHEGPGRIASVSGSEAALARLRRSLAIAAFLDDAGWPGAQRSFLLGDASTRAYEIVRRDDGRIAILMNAPRRPDGPPIRDGKPYSQIAHLAETVTPFVAIAAELRMRGFHAPEIYAADLDAGLVLLEHLGAESFLDADGKPIAERYEAAARLLAHLHARDWPSELPAAQGVAHRMPPYHRRAMLIEVELLIDWYMPYASGRPVSPDERAAYIGAWNAVIDRLEGAEKGLVLRDYHSPNLIWRAEESGDDRLGVIDFQDALIGPLAYDVASLGQDARVTIEPELEAAVRSAYVVERAAKGAFDRAAFDEAYAIMAAQRNSKILGIFVRLNERDGKPAYLKHLPRIRAYLRRSLAHPALAPLIPIYRNAGILDEETA